MIPKFRAWDKNTADVVDIKTIDLEKDGSIGCLVDYSGINLDVSECIIMQSTGLKDKNGVEIFEGDIVKTLGADLEVTFSTIKFEEGAFCVDYKDLGTEFVFLYFVDSPLEVIGNIYENSELLEEQR